MFNSLLQYFALFLPVLMFYINWANSHVAVDIHDGAEDALSQQRLILKQNRHAANFKEALHQDSGNEIEGINSVDVTVSHEKDIHDIQEAKLRIRELETKLMELDKRIPKKFPEVSFRPFDRKRILV